MTDELKNAPRSKRASRPVIAITMGEPAGIGPEVVIKALADPEIMKLGRFIIYGMNELLSYAADLAEFNTFWYRLQHDSPRATYDLMHDIVVLDYDEYSILGQASTEAKVLCDLARKHGALLQVGHTERFNPAVRAILDMNINARFMEIARISPMTFRSLDVSVVMDMMIHDLDIALTLAGSPLADVQASGVSVMSDQEDIANARLVFESGCVANITASRLALKTERKIRVFSETAYLSLDYQKRSGFVIQKSDNSEALERVRKQIGEGADLSDVDYSDLVQVEELDMDDPSGEQMDPLTAEQTDFLTALAENGKPEVDGEAGYQAVVTAEKVIASIREHRYEGLTDTRV